MVLAFCIVLAYMELAYMLQWPCTGFISRDKSMKSTFLACDTEL